MSRLGLNKDCGGPLAKVAREKGTLEQFGAKFGLNDATLANANNDGPLRYRRSHRGTRSIQFAKKALSGLGSGRFKFGTKVGKCFYEYDKKRLLKVFGDLSRVDASRCVSVYSVLRYINDRMLCLKNGGNIILTSNSVKFLERMSHKEVDESS